MTTTPAAHIVLIEDEAEIAETVQFAIERAGMRATWAASGAAGLASLTDAADLVILDVGLPDMDGFEVLKTIRRESDIPVIMLTAQHEEIDRVLGLELGADDYVGKPFSLRELMARIKAILKRHVEGREAAETAADESDASDDSDDCPFQFDDAQQHYRYQGEPLPFTLAEQRLFGALLAQPDRVFSREQLLAAIWSDHHPTDARAIDTHVKAIRSKLREVAPDAQYIVTHRGLGYSLTLCADSVSRS